MWVDVRVGAAAGNSRKASLRRCSSVCDLSDTRQFYKNIGKCVPGRGNSQGEGAEAGAAWQVGRSRRKAPGSAGVEWVRPRRAGGLPGGGRSWGSSGAEAARRVASGVTVSLNR